MVGQVTPALALAVFSVADVSRAVWFDRAPLAVRSYKDDKTEANVWAGRSRFGAGFGDFRAMSYVSFSTVAPANADEITPVVTGVSLTKSVQ